MSLQDTRKTNATINDTLVVGREFRAPTIQATNVIVDTITAKTANVTEHINLSGAIISGAILGVADLMVETLTLASTTNELRFGPNAEVKFNVDTSLARTISLAPGSVDALLVLTEGNHTVNGFITLTSPLTITSAANQIVLGSGPTITLHAPSPASSRIYTIPDAGLDSIFVMTEGAQTVNGSKTFASTQTFQTSIVLSQLFNQIVFGSGQTITVTAPSPGLSVIYTIPDVAADARFVMTEGTQTINGNKIFTGTNRMPFLTLENTSDQLILGTGTTIKLTAPTPAADRTYSISDVGLDASFVMTEGAQTINGIKTLGNNLFLPTVGGTATAFNFYEELFTTIDFTGPFAGTQTVNLYLIRNGRQVTMTLQGFATGAGGAAGNIVSTTNLALRFRPPINVIQTLVVENNTVNVSGSLTVSSGGTLTLQRFDGTNYFVTFQNTGTIGFSSCILAWNVIS